MERRQRLVTVTLFVGLLSSNLVVSALRSGDRVFGARTVASFVNNEHQVVYTDVRTKRTATFFLFESPTLTSLIRSGVPTPDSLYFFDAFQHAKETLRTRTPDSAWRPPSNWTEISTIQQPPSFVDDLLGTFMGSILPAGAVKWRNTRRTALILYRTPMDAVDIQPSGPRVERPPLPLRCDPWKKIR